MSRVGDSEASSTSSLNFEFEIANPTSAKGNCLSEQSSCLYIGSRSSGGIEHFLHNVDPKMNSLRHKTYCIHSLVAEVSAGGIAHRSCYVVHLCIGHSKINSCFHMDNMFLCRSSLFSLINKN